MTIMLGQHQLEETEMLVLLALPHPGAHVTFGQLRSRTSLPAQELNAALQGLKTKGILVRLNTVVESWARSRG